MPDIIRKVIEFYDDSRDCECCGTYTDMWVMLDCGHHEDVGCRVKIGTKIRCSECSGDYLDD